MVFSKTHSPHVGTVAEVDLTKVMALRDKHKGAFAKSEGFALTLLPFAAMATVRALKEFPQDECVGSRRFGRHPPRNQSWHRDGRRRRSPRAGAQGSGRHVGDWSRTRNRESAPQRSPREQLGVDDLAGGSSRSRIPGARATSMVSRLSISPKSESCAWARSRSVR